MNDPAAARHRDVPLVEAVEAYDFASPSILFGPGRVIETGEAATRFGRKAWLVTGRRVDSPAARAVRASLVGVGMPCEWIAGTAVEPTVADVVRGLAKAAKLDSEGVVVIGVGGGGAIDLAKAIAAIVTNGLEGAILAGATDEAIEACLVDRLEGVGRGMPITRQPLPVVAVPTTAGTGSEATRNAVISCPVRRFKKSLRSPLIVPRAAVVDPRLTATCPPGVAAASGLDCIAQLVEAYVTRLHRPIPRAIVEAALPRAIASLPVVVRAAGDEHPTPEVEAARAAMSHAATCSGLALANAGLGLAHGVAAPLGIECGTPHGVACGMLLPLAIRINVRSRAGDFATLERLVEAVVPAIDRPSRSSDDASAAAAFLERIERLRDAVGIPKTLSSVGLARDRIEWLASNSGGASMRGNPVELSPEQLAAELARMHA